MRDQCPSNFNTLGCGHSLFPLRDSRGKRTREPANAKSPMALKRDARVESIAERGKQFLRALAGCFGWTSP